MPLAIPGGTGFLFGFVAGEAECSRWSIAEDSEWSLTRACNIVSVKVQSTSKPALRPMERSGIGLSAGRRPLQEPETGLVGARPQLDNGGVKI